MTESMIDRVAKAIRRRRINLHGHTPAPDHMLDYWIEIALALAAIEAMRTPTPEMIAALHPVDRNDPSEALDTWQRMISAALKEGKGNG